MEQLEKVEPRELSHDEFVVLLEERVRASLGISLAEFVEGLDSGSLDPELPRIAGLAMLLGARTS